METYLLIAAGGVLGANARYLIALWAAGRFGTAFPHGTLVANVSGSLLMGLAVALIGSRFDGSSAPRLLVMTGFLGAYTTFSTFAFESVTLLREGAFRLAAINVFGSVLLGLLGMEVGLAVGRII